MIHRSESKNRATAGVLEGQGEEEPECSQAKRWQTPDGPTAHGHGGSCGEGPARVSGSPVRSKHGEKPELGWGTALGEWGPDAGLWAIYR